jgi:hypothetical protein
MEPAFVRPERRQGDGPSPSPAAECGSDSVGNIANIGKNFEVKGDKEDENLKLKIHHGSVW